MASATSSLARKRPQSLASLAAALESALAQRPVPLLVLRLPEFERVAWRAGKRAAQRVERETTRAFLAAAARLLRAGDLLGHDPGSDVFAIVMTSPSREGRPISPVDCRSALERIAAAISMVCDLRVEIGWTVLRRYDRVTGLQPEIEVALERGARERERYEFFAAIGHELRTPLTSIRGYLETLLDMEVDGRTARRFLETARREALRLGRLVDGMFEFSLLDLSAGAMVSAVCDLEEQVARVVESVAPLSRARRIAIQYAVPPVRVALEADACVQALVNLVENAVKYGRDGGTIRISARKDYPFVNLSVEDDGPGIAIEERNRIFGLRVRGAGAGERPGTGIGLAIVKLIVERAGGEIRVAESSLGGAHFELSLPVWAESAAFVS
ncbi:MAG: sensor histidine kinase [Vulcanimicrobiaceae bacterium]